MTAPAPAPALPSGAVRLSDWGVIRAVGADAATFLHGQLTQDMLHLEPGAAHLAGYCSAKGRLLATFVVWRPAPDLFLLACSADLLPTVLKRLSMFVMRAKCKLGDVTAEWPLWGVAGAAVAPLLGDAARPTDWTRTVTSQGDAIMLPAARVDAERVRRMLLAGPGAMLPESLAPEAWRWLEARSGVARVMAATADQFVPQMINLDLVGGVNFQKGCYPGQEVVARSQYRGTLKRRGVVVDSPVPLWPGQEVFHSSADPGQPAGHVVLAGSLAGRGHTALLELKRVALESGTLHIGSADGPTLGVGELPYAIPAEAT